ncbi:MAG: alpha/beta hydrolase [Acidimicrobiales bacterium]
MSTTDGAARIERTTLHTSDGIDLVAELIEPGDVEAAMVACHPHPLYGGSMHANVVDALFRALPADGTAVLRFNFRGANGSGGEHDGGGAERLDVTAALDAAADRWPGVPLLLAGYSFGADVALAVDHDRVVAWFVVAPPLRIVERREQVALNDERPVHVVAGAHDQYRAAAEARELLADAVNVTVTEAPGADHFFAVGLTTVVEAARRAVAGAAA